MWGLIPTGRTQEETDFYFLSLYRGQGVVDKGIEPRRYHQAVISVQNKGNHMTGDKSDHFFGDGGIRIAGSPNHPNRDLTWVLRNGIKCGLGPKGCFLRLLSRPGQC